MESGVRQMQQLGKTLLSHASGILSWWKHRISNGRMEGINNKIKTPFARPTASATNASSPSNSAPYTTPDSHFSDEP
jgi:hypothetical protein